MCEGYEKSDTERKHPVAVLKVKPTVESEHIRQIELGASKFSNC